MRRLALSVLSRLDPERAHDWGLTALRMTRPLWPTARVPPGLSVACLGLEFSHPLGLAAGFDKNADYLDALGDIGFSHVELGTVTPRPQRGNPRPRMFRATQLNALVNRMGFNNKGVDHLVARLQQSRYAGIRGISIGKNADTPLENAELDYVACLRRVYDHADYVAINVSSPNTARLRELQARDGLERIVGSLLVERRLLAQTFGKQVPLLVKVAPNLDAVQIKDLCATLRELGVDGLIATNTSTDLSPLGAAWPEADRGGLSGAPLHSLSLSLIERVRSHMGPDFPIIGVGGIIDFERALATLRAGATLIQIYTGFAYRGHVLVQEILDALAGRRHA